MTESERAGHVFECELLAVSLKTIRDSGVIHWRGALPGLRADMPVEVTFAAHYQPSATLARDAEDSALTALRRIQESTKPVDTGDF